MSDSGIFRRAWQWCLNRVTVEWDDLEELDEDCPNCGGDEYYRENVRFAPDVYRCRDCGAEGMGKL